MAKRPSFERSLTDVKRGTVGTWTPDAKKVKLASEKALYRGSGKHKTYPSPTKEWIVDPKTDATKCDKYSPKDWPKLQRLLREAILSGCTGGDSEDLFPFRVWAYINDVLHEARRTNAQNGEYHAFPLDYKEHHPIDPKKILRNAPRAIIAVI
jgi:hypothetical protein